ncbi:MAG: response regulator [Thermomicrobiales bacterium]
MDTENPQSILLVEDEPVLQRTLFRSLQVRRYDVLAVGSAAEAITETAERQFGVILLDVNLPDATGWDVLRALRARAEPTPVIVLSAAPPNPDRVREFRPSGVLLKPFPIDALLHLIGATGAAPEREPQAAREVW